MVKYGNNFYNFFLKKKKKKIGNNQYQNFNIINALNKIYFKLTII